jgi:hypothetical protein
MQPARVNVTKQLRRRDTHFLRQLNIQLQKLASLVECSTAKTVRVVEYSTK